jgi:ABC-2 type transport system ATP-binding protein
LVSSHNLPEISQTCDRLLVIHQGEIVAQGSEQELAQRSGAHGAVEIEVRGAGEPAIEALKSVEGVRGVAVDTKGGSSPFRDSASVALRVDAAPEIRPKLVRALVAKDIDVMRVDAVSGQLESIFLKLTQTRN